jgi:hypothetical protein
MKKNWFDCIEELCVVGLAPSGDDIDILKLKKGRGTDTELCYLRFLWGIVKKLSYGRPLTEREAQSFTRDLYEHQIAYAGAWQPGEKVEIDCAWLKTNRPYVKAVMKHINARFSALLRVGQQAGKTEATGGQVAGNRSATGRQHGCNLNRSLEDQRRDKELDKDKELDTNENATASLNEFISSTEASPEFVPSAPSEPSASPISSEEEEAIAEPVREDVPEVNEEEMSAELLATRRELAELGDKAVLEEFIEASESEVVDLPERMEVAVFENTNAKNKKEYRVQVKSGKRTFYAGKFLGLLGWDNQMPGGRGSGRDKTFYLRIYNRLRDYEDKRMFSHLTDEKNKRQPNTLVALHVDDQAVAIITPKGQWVGDLQAAKSRNPKAPLLKGIIGRE